MRTQRDVIKKQVITPFIQDSENIMEGEMKWLLRARDQSKTVSLGHDRDAAAIMNSAAVIACPRAAQNQASQYSSMQKEGGRTHKPQPLPEELLMVDGY